VLSQLPSGCKIQIDGFYAIACQRFYFILDMGDSLIMFPVPYLNNGISCKTFVPGLYAIPKKRPIIISDGLF
jgi:uncharacterized membrane protein YGL010W